MAKSGGGQQDAAVEFDSEGCVLTCSLRIAYGLGSRPTAAIYPEIFCLLYNR